MPKGIIFGDGENAIDATREYSKYMLVSTASLKNPSLASMISALGELMEYAVSVRGREGEECNLHTLHYCRSRPKASCPSSTTVTE